jgi:hypothetical protein
MARFEESKDGLVHESMETPDQFNASKNIIFQINSLNFNQAV